MLKNAWDLIIEKEKTGSNYQTFVDILQLIMVSAKNKIKMSIPLTTNTSSSQHQSSNILGDF